MIFHLNEGMNQKWMGAKDTKQESNIVNPGFLTAFGRQKVGHYVSRNVTFSGMGIRPKKPLYCGPYCLGLLRCHLLPLIANLLPKLLLRGSQFSDPAPLAWTLTWRLPHKLSTFSFVPTTVNVPLVVKSFIARVNEVLKAPGPDPINRIQCNIWLLDGIRPIK